MTVQQLIDTLKQLDPDLTVLMNNGDDYVPITVSQESPDDLCIASEHTQIIVIGEE